MFFQRITLFKNFFIKVKFRKHKIHHFNHFRVYYSIVLNIFTMLYNHLHCLILEYFHQARKKPRYY